MSYEVYIDVRHSPRHLDDFEQTLKSAARFVEPQDSDPSDADRMRAVCYALRDMADEYDPDWKCSHCGELRSAHYGYPDAVVRCFNQYGPTTQWAWWMAETPA